MVEMRDLYLVTTDELQPLFEANRVLKYVAQNGLQQERIHLLLNRDSPDGRTDVHDIEKALGCPACGVIPEQGEQMQEAYSEGHFLDEALPIYNEINKLVAKSLGLSPKTDVPGFFDFFRVGRSPAAAPQ